MPDGSLADVGGQGSRDNMKVGFAMRRYLGCGLWLALACHAGAAQNASVAASSIPGVEVLGPLAAGYDTAVERFFGPTRRATLADWLPFGVVVTNRTPQAIAAVAICWQLATSGGETLQYRLEYEAFNRSSGQLAAGQTGVAVGMYWMSDPRRLPAPLRSKPPGSAQDPGGLPEFQNAQSVEATLDGVVFASGQFVGPDNFKEYESYLANATVPPRIAAKVLERNAAGEPVADIVAWLKTKAGQTINLNADGWWNTNAEVHAARQLLHSFEQGGQNQLYQAAQQITVKPAIQLYR